MPIFFEKKQLVTPGELLAEGDYLAGENTYLEQGKIFADRIGLVDTDNKKVNVVALRAFYVPKMGDIVIGTVVEVGFNGWTVDIKSPYTALLRASDVLSRPFKPQNDELSAVLSAGDLIVAKIASYDRAHDPQLTVGEPGLGKITRGRILQVTPTKIPRIIGRKGSMISMIKQESGCQIILGLNGMILVTGKTPEEEELAIKAIRKIEEESHTSGLTDRITQLLKESKGIVEEKVEENKLNEKLEKLIDKKGIRTDGRKADELRPVKLQVGVLSNADGSAYIEHGKNKILAAAYGPREMHPKHLAQPDRMVLRCRYHMAPFSVQERKSPAPSRREVELSKVIKESLEPALFLELYPRTGVDVFVEVLQADGGTRCASITAAALAIADAGVPMRDLVVGCAAGKVDDTVVLDLYDAEDKLGAADVPVAYMPSLNAITLLQMDGELSSEEFEKAISMAIDGCKKIYELQKEALKTKYMVVKEVGEE